MLTQTFKHLQRFELIERKDNIFRVKLYKTTYVRSNAVRIGKISKIRSKFIQERRFEIISAYLNKTAVRRFQFRLN